jgi:hypothetical protein
MPSSSESARAFWRGWSRVLLAPEAILGVWLATGLAALPAAMAMHDAIRGQLGSSMTASQVAAGFDYGWWEEFEAQARGVARTLSPIVIGAAAPISNWSSLMDGQGVSRPVLAYVVFGLSVWLFLSGGLIDRFARGRRVGTRAFFGTCGLFFFRFLRLGVFIGAAYYVLVGWFHEVLFDVLLPWITHEMTSERAAFAWRVLLYLIWLAPLVAVNIIADYAKVRAVVEDRRSMVGALAAGARFVARHPLAASGLYLTNTLVLAVCFSIYLLAAPGARGGDWRLLEVLAIGQAWILARVATKLAFLSTSAALFQGLLAHSEYTAPPVPVWPESPAAEAIENAVRFGVRPEP